MKWLVVPRGQVNALRAAIAQAEGFPRRSVVVGGIDALPASYVPGAPGWTDQACEEPEEGVALATIGVPPEFEKHCGKQVGAVSVPNAAALLDEDALPAELLVLVRARKGQGPGGSPLPFSAAPAAQGRAR